jgi:two-component system response regulator FixJ
MTNEGFVHVIDDDLAVRDSLKFLLEAAQLPVRTYESAADFLKALPDVKTGCVITDVRMPDVSGIELLRHVRSTVHSLPVIVITGHGDIPLAVEAMKIGAIDFFEKPFDDDAFLAAVRLALKRKEREEKQESDRAELHGRIAALSARERQVLEGLVAGQANKIIAFNLKISPRTVEIYRANVMTKMQAKSLSELVRMALIAGVLEGSADDWNG